MPEDRGARVSQHPDGEAIVSHRGLSVLSFEFEDDGQAEHAEACGGKGCH